MLEPFTIGGQSITPGERKLVILPVSKLSNHTPVTLPVHVLHGKRQLVLPCLCRRPFMVMS